MTEVTTTRLKMTKLSYRWRASLNWNTMNDELRSFQSLPQFNKKVRAWLIEQRPQIPEPRTVTPDRTLEQDT